MQIPLCRQNINTLLKEGAGIGKKRGEKDGAREEGGSGRLPDFLAHKKNRNPLSLESEGPVP